MAARKPLALGVRKTLTPTTIDDKAGPAADPWSDVPAREDFLCETGDGPTPASNDLGLRLQAARTGGTVRLRIHCPPVKASRSQPQARIDKGDHVAVVLASRDRTVRVLLAPDGRREVNGVKGEEATICVRGERHGWTADIEVPTMPDSGRRPVGRDPWRFNVVMQCDRDRYVFSPTLGETPAYENGANLICE